MDEQNLIDVFGEVVSDLDINYQQYPSIFYEKCRYATSLNIASDNHERLEELKLETRLWLLLDTLRSKDTKNFDYANRVEWLSLYIEKPQHPAEISGVKWVNTQADIGTVTKNEVTELDVDGPLRQGRPVNVRDNQLDYHIFKYIFQLLLLSEYELATKFCADTNNWTLRGAIQYVYGIEAVDAVFIENCRAMSSDTQSQKLDVYERGIYGILGRDINAVKPLCTTWEELLLAHIRTQNTIDEFKIALQSSSPEIQQEGNNHYRQLMLALIEGESTFKQYVEQLVSELNVSSDPADLAEEKLENAVLINKIDLVRTILHIQIVFQHVLEPVVRLYVVQLCDDSHQPQSINLVPAYIKELNVQEQPSIYGQVLAELMNPILISQQLEIAEQFPIDLYKCLEHALNLNFELYEQNVAVKSVSERVIRCICTTLEAKRFELGFQSAINAYHLFLLNKDINGAIELSLSLDIEHLKEQVFNISAESGYTPEIVLQLSLLRDYAALSDCCYKLNEASNICGVGTQLPFTASEESLVVVNAACDSIFVGLQFEGPEDIKTSYFPEIVSQLLKIVERMETVANRFSVIVMQLATKLADDKDELYKYFSTDMLGALVNPYLDSQVCS